MTAPRQIDLERIRLVLEGKTLSRGRFFNETTGTDRYDALGMLAHVANIPDYVLHRVDEFASGRVVSVGITYTRAHFVRDCHVIDRALATYGITPADRRAIADVNDVGAMFDTAARWMAVCGVVLTRNKILAAGRDPDEQDLTHYRGSISAAFELSRNNRAPLREKDNGTT